MLDPNQPGLVANWGLGSGKTLGSIAVADALGTPADVVVPAALQENYAKEQRKHTDEPPPTTLQSIENVARKGGNTLHQPLLIVDEAHRTRNPGKTNLALQRSPAEKRLALTGSLIYNHPADMAGPVNLVAGRGTIPMVPSEFEKKYVRERRVGPGIWGSLTGKPGHTVLEPNPKTAPELKKILSRYVDYYPGSTENFPTRTDETIRVPMSAHQQKLYDAVLDTAPPWVRQKVLSNLPPTKTEAKQLNAFLSAVRQVSNTTAGFDTAHAAESPKIDLAVHKLQEMLKQNPQGRAVVYSNYLPSGIHPYKAQLDKAKIPYGEFTGEMDHKERDELVRQYNDGKLRALLLSSAGGEGLDLKGTRLIQLLDPAWNE
jgi:SNF2 family DNA or RNA helicase